MRQTIESTKNKFREDNSGVESSDLTYFACERLKVTIYHLLNNPPPPKKKRVTMYTYSQVSI